MCFKIKYHLSIFEKYIIFNIDEHIYVLRTKRQSTFLRSGTKLESVQKKRDTITPKTK